MGFYEDYYGSSCDNSEDNYSREAFAALVRGLVTYEGESQYYEGTPCIKGRNLEVLLRAIERKQ